MPILAQDRGGQSHPGRAEASAVAEARPLLLSKNTSTDSRSFFRNATDLGVSIAQDRRNWPVPGLLAPGLTLFFAAAKAGKTRALIDIGWNVASGNLALGSLLTHQGDVLLVLSETPFEDVAELRQDLWPDESPPGALTLVTQEEWYEWVEHSRTEGRDPVTGRPGRVGLAPLLDTWRGEVGRPSLVVVDNLTNCVLNHQQIDQRQRAHTQDYMALERIRSWSHAHDVPVVMIHHTNQSRLENGDDWTFLSAGSMGINSVPDHLMLLKEFDGGLSLFVKGRKLANQTLTLLRRGPHLMMFDPVPVSSRTGDRMKSVLTGLVDGDPNTPGEASVAQVAGATGIPQPTVRRYLARLVDSGHVARVGYGRYRMVLKGESGASS